MKQVLSFLLFVNFYFITKAQSNSNSSKGTMVETPTSCPQLIFKFATGMTRMPAIVLKHLDKARVEMSDFSKSSYRLQKFTITILSDTTHTYKSLSNEGDNFTQETKDFLNSLKPNDILMISGITAINENGKVINVEERNFGVY